MLKYLISLRLLGVIAQNFLAVDVPIARGNEIPVAVLACQLNIYVKYIA